MSEASERSGAGPVVALEPVARFGKLHAGSDYSWVAGGNALPPGLATTSELIADLAEVAISVAAGLEGACWLARAFHGGPDSANRAVVSVEVVRATEPALLSPREMLLLAAISFDWPEAPHREPFEAMLPQPLSEDAALDAELLARFRLGLPISTTPAVALELVQRHSWRYDGICHARRPTRVPIPWRRELAPYLCVNFGEATLGREEALAVRSVVDRQPSEEEWAALEEVSPAHGVRALASTQAVGGPAGIFDPADPLLPWLVAYLANWHPRGERLLSAVRRALAPAPIPASLLSSIVPGLGDEARAVLGAALEGGAPSLTLEVAEELASGGLLGTVDELPLRLWAGWTRSSALLAEQALASLAAMGIAPPDARFVLDLRPEAATSGRQSGGSGVAAVQARVEAVSVASKLGLPAPRQRLLAWLSRIDSMVRLGTFAEVGDRYGGWARELGKLALLGELPQDPSELGGAEMAAAIRARRAAGYGSSLEVALGSLLATGHRQPAAELLEAAIGDEQLAPNEAVAAVLRARLGLAPPAGAPAPHQLAPLIHHGLARAGDVAPPPGADLVALGELWSETQPLARLLLAPETAIGAPPEVPEPWLSAVRAVLTPARAKRWLAALSADDRASARSWLVRLHGLEDVQAFWDEGTIPADREAFVRALPWLDSLLPSDARSHRLSALARLATSEILRDDETLAGELASRLLPPAGRGDRAVDLAIHALSARGPLPALQGLAADLIVVLAPALDPVALADALFAGEALEASEETSLGGALAARLAESGRGCPAAGYTARQLARHPLLAQQLGAVAGWEAVAPAEEDRRRLLSRLSDRLGLSAVTARPAEASEHGSEVGRDERQDDEQS